MQHPHSPPADSLVALLRHRATAQPDALAYTFLVDGERQASTLTWAQLDARAQHIAAWLQRHTAPQARVMLLFPEGLDYLAALLGCMYAQALAVPVHPPDPKRLQRTVPRLQSVAADAQPSVVLTDAALIAAQAEITALAPTLAPALWQALDALPAELAEQWQPVSPARDALAYLQYTSGSTSSPKGVMISHHNLLHQLADFDVGYDHSPASVICSWLPATHDLGLVYGRFMGLFIGCHTVFFSPNAFVQRPARWPLALSHYRATHTAAPNFGFELAARKTSDQDLLGLDLSALRVALNGAEPIKQPSELAFIERFTPAGLSPAAVTHAMGMSESTAKIMSEPPSRAPARFEWVDARAYERGEVRVVPAHTPGAHAVASNGFTTGDTRVVVVDALTLTDLGSDQVGELWVSGQTVAQGYWNRPEDTASQFGARLADGTGPFMRTGDTGFIHQGEIFLGGRLKDLIIIRGQNHHPQDLEWSAEAAHPAVRPNCAAAFSVRSPAGEEAVALVAEVAPLPDPEPVFAALRAALADHGLAAQTLVLLEPKGLPKTSSGKIQRSEARRQLLEGELAQWARWDRPPEQQAAQASALDLHAPNARAALTARLLQLASAKIGVSPDDLDLTTPVRELGLDSIQAVELVDQLGHELGLAISGTLLFDHPTLDGLASALLSAAAPTRAPAQPSKQPAPKPADRAAVAAMSEAEAEAALAALLEGLD